MQHFALPVVYFHQDLKGQVSAQSGLQQEFGEWHKMKSRGQSKKGKLLKHFTCDSLCAAMNDYCHFIHKGK